MIFSLHPHQENYFKDILAGIPTTLKRIVIDKWHWVLGEICSMAIVLPSAWGLLSHTKEALFHMEGKRVTLTKGFHQTITEFCFLAKDLGRRPTVLYDPMPLQPTLNGYHDTSGYMTCSSPRRTVRSHSLVCSENPFSVVGIGPIPVKEL